MHSYLTDPESVPLPPDGMAVFERRPANRVLLDDTDPLTCNIEGHQQRDDHTVRMVAEVRATLLTAVPVCTIEFYPCPRVTSGWKWNPYSQINLSQLQMSTKIRVRVESNSTQDSTRYS